MPRIGLNNRSHRGVKAYVLTPLRSWSFEGMWLCARRWSVYRNPTLERRLRGLPQTLRHSGESRIAPLSLRQQLTVVRRECLNEHALKPCLYSPEDLLFGWILEG